MKTLHELALEQLKVGDYVRITHKVPSQSHGWIHNWVDSMNKYIGHTGQIIHLNSTDITIEKAGGYAYPATAVEKVDPPLPKHLSITLSSGVVINYIDGSYKSDQFEYSWAAIHFRKVITSLHAALNGFVENSWTILGDVKVSVNIGCKTLSGQDILDLYNWIQKH